MEARNTEGGLRRRSLVGCMCLCSLFSQPQLPDLLSGGPEAQGSVPGESERRDHLRIYPLFGVCGGQAQAQVLRTPPLTAGQSLQ